RRTILIGLPRPEVADLLVPQVVAAQHAVDVAALVAGAERVDDRNRAGDAALAGHGLRHRDDRGGVQTAGQLRPGRARRAHTGADRVAEQREELVLVVRRVALRLRLEAVGRP